VSERVRAQQLPALRPPAIRRRRRTLLWLVLFAVAALVGWDVTHERNLVPATLPFLPALPVPSATPEVVVEQGAGTFRFAAVEGPVVGTDGPVMRYRVAVEDGVGLDVEDFGAAVEEILSDPRSWTAGATVRFQRVAEGTEANFTIYLASPATSERMCRTDGLNTDRYTNCRLHDGRVIINTARWLTAVVNYGAPLADYRAYAVNHEVGHQLGYGHEACPGPGRPAPVMQQQTLALAGCLPYGWPYRDGVRYAGPAVAG
jgi:hypothetical protein